MQKVIDRLNAWAHWKRIEINSMRNSVTPYKNMDAVDDEELFLEDVGAVISAATKWLKTKERMAVCEWCRIEFIGRSVFCSDKCFLAHEALGNSNES